MMGKWTRSLDMHIYKYCLFILVFTAQQGHWLRPVFGAGFFLHPKLHHGLRLHSHLLRGQSQGASATGEQN